MLPYPTQGEKNMMPASQMLENIGDMFARCGSHAEKDATLDQLLRGVAKHDRHALVIALLPLPWATDDGWPIDEVKLLITACCFG